MFRINKINLDLNYLNLIWGIIKKENEKNFNVQIANDNSEGQIVLSGKIEDLDKLI